MLRRIAARISVPGAENLPRHVLRRAVGQMLFERYGAVTFAEVLGTRPSISEADLASLPVRAQRAVRMAAPDAPSRISEIPVQVIGEMRTIGVNTLSDIAIWLMRLASRPPRESAAVEVAASCHGATGVPTVTLLREANDQPDDVPHGEDVPPSLDKLINRAAVALASLPELWGRVYAERVLKGSRRPTLEIVGSTVGKTRERVRQIQQRAETQMATALAAEASVLRTELDPKLQPVGDLVSALLADPGTLDKVEQEDPSDPSSAALLCLLAVSGFRAQDGLVGAAESWAALDAVRERLAGAQRLPLSTVRRQLSEVLRDVEPRRLAQLLDAAGLEVTADGWVERRAANLRGSLDQVFEREGRPLSKEDLIELSGLSEMQVRGLLGRSAAYMVVRKGAFAPVSWGMPAYPGTSNALRLALEKRGGQAAIDDLVREVVDAWGCTRNSCLIYLQSPEFARTGSKVTLVQPTERQLTEGNPARQRNVYSDLNNGLVWAVDVDRDVLRGSGRQVPRSVAVALGLNGRLSVEVEAPGGVLTVRWGRVTPAIGSLRRLAAALQAKMGDRLLIRLPQAGNLRFDLAPRSSDPRDATRFVGLPRSDDLERAGALLAMACWEPDTVIWREVLWDRNEDEILALLGLPEEDPRPRNLNLIRFDHALTDCGWTRKDVIRTGGIAPQTFTSSDGGRTVRLTSRTLTKVARLMSRRLALSEEAVLAALFEA